MSCNISIPMEDIIEAVREELAKEFISIENGVGNNTTLNSPNIKGDVTFDSAARDALCSALAECVDEKLKALEDELDGKIEDTEAALRQAIADAKEDLEGDIDLLRKSFEDSQKQQDEAFNAKIAAQKELLEKAIAAGDDALGARIDGLDTKVDHQREDLEKAIEAGDKALDTRIDGLDTKVDHQREDLEKAIEAGDKALDTRIDGLDGKVDKQREGLEKAIAAGDDALGARIDNLDGKVDHQREDLEQAIAAGDEALEKAIAAGDKALGARIDGLDGKVDQQREGLEKAIAAGDKALDTRIDGLDGKVDQQREGLEKAIAAGDKALDTRIDGLDGKVDQQRGDLEKAIAAGDKALDTRIDGLDGKVDQQREGLEKAIAAGDAALGARIDNLEGMTSKISRVSRDADIVTIEMTDGSQHTFSVKDTAFAADRPVKFAPSANGNNIEITLADGTAVGMTRQEFAEWLAGKDSPIATDDELRNAIAAAKGDLKKQIDALQKKLDTVNTDQAKLEVASGNLVLTNEDGSKSTVALSKLAKVSAAAGNSAEVRADGIYVPTVKPGNDGFDKISPDANNIIVNKTNGLFVPPTAIDAGTGIEVTGKGTAEDPYVIVNKGGNTDSSGDPKPEGGHNDHLLNAVKFDVVKEVGQLEYVNKSGEQRSVMLAETYVVPDKTHPYGNQLVRWYFVATSDKDIINDEIKTDTFHGNFYLDPDFVDFDKPVVIHQLNKIGGQIGAFIPMVADGADNSLGSEIGNVMAYYYEPTKGFIGNRGSELVGAKTEGAHIRSYISSSNNPTVLEQIFMTFTGDSNDPKFELKPKPATLDIVKQYGMYFSDEELYRRDDSRNDPRGSGRFNYTDIDNNTFAPEPYDTRWKYFPEG